MDELVSRMSDAYWDLAYRMEPRSVCMTAAAKVLLEAALGEPTKEEAARIPYALFAKRLLANRKARLLAPKTIEERVTIEFHANGMFRVELDGSFRHWFTAETDAETFKRGLIAEMKEKG